MFKRKRTQIILAISAIVLFSPFAYAEDNTAQQLQDEAKKYSESMPTGSVPATNILGVADSNVPRVTNFKSIASQLSQGLDKDGKIKNALGFEVAPYLLANDKLKWNDYDSHYLTRLLTRTTVSFAAIPASDGKTASSAFGTQSVLYSEAVDKAKNKWVSEPICKETLRKYSAEYQDAISEILTKFPAAVSVKLGSSPTVENETEVKDSVLLAKYKESKNKWESAPKNCQDTVDKALQIWNASVVAVGLGWGFFSPDNNAKTLKTSSSVYWLTAAFGWGDGMSNTGAAGGLLTAHARKATDERVADPNNVNNFLAEQSTLYGANLRYGSRTFGLLLEYSARKGSVSGLSDENVRRGFIGVDAKVSEDIYLSWGVGSETGKRDGINRPFSLANIKYAFGNKPIFQ